MIYFLPQWQKQWGIGIVLSGYDHDATERCKQIKATGGKTFAQDISAEVNFMPFIALKSG